VVGVPVGALVTALVAALTLAGCNSATKLNHKVVVSSLPVFSPTFPSPTATVSIPVSIPASTAVSSASAGASSSASVIIHPAPASPVRVAHVDTAGRHYDISVWFDVTNIDCAGHAYGEVAAFLTTHPCRGLTRQLATTTVHGRAVGFAASTLGIAGSDAQHPYDNAAAFRTLVDSDGTGNVNDLLREGYRLPSGPSAVPSPDAFRVLAQDAGVTIYDMWYLDGPTPNNDAALEQLAQDIYLQY
jgi:hypothetical protein